jgi:hypothetical protein
MLNFRQWFHIGEAMNIWDELFKSRGIWQYPFAAVKRDEVEGWYADFFANPFASDISQVSIGDKVADRSLNFTPYWDVSGIDEDKGRVYLNPIEPNPFLSGVGAGGHKFGQHDYDVLSGKHERERTDQIMQRWQGGMVFEPRDVAYLLLGTIESHVGPNGTQGGWYNAGDTWSNRGGKKGLDAKEIVMKDATTLKNVFKMSVPRSALDGTLDPRDWSDFVQGGASFDRSVTATKLDEEDFENAEKMIDNILNHPQPTIRMRNVDKLVDWYLYHGNIRKAVEDKSEEEADKWRKGDYRKKELDNDVREMIRKMVSVEHPKQKEMNFDPYWHAKEKLIHLCEKMDWNDLLRSFENSKWSGVRESLSNAYARQKNIEGMWRMLEKEDDVGVLRNLISSLGREDRVPRMKKWIADNREKLNKAIKADTVGYYGAEIRKQMKAFDELDVDTWKTHYDKFGSDWGVY